MRLTLPSQLYAGAILQQQFIVEFIIQGMQCPDCAQVRDHKLFVLIHAYVSHIRNINGTSWCKFDRKCVINARFSSWSSFYSNMEFAKNACLSDCPLLLFSYVCSLGKYSFMCSGIKEENGGLDFHWSTRNTAQV